MKLKSFDRRPVEIESQTVITPVGHISDHLANERTYLAWLRTAFALIGLGFATHKFSQFLAQLPQSSMTPQLREHGTRFMGSGMVIFGALLIPIAALRYIRVRNAIESRSALLPFQLLWIVTSLAVIFGISCVGILLFG